MSIITQGLRNGRDPLWSKYNIFYKAETRCLRTTLFSDNIATETSERQEQREVFERRYHISAEEESNGRGDSNNTSQVSNINLID